MALKHRLVKLEAKRNRNGEATAAAYVSQMPPNIGRGTWLWLFADGDRPEVLDGSARAWLRDHADSAKDDARAWLDGH